MTNKRGVQPLNKHSKDSITFTSVCHETEPKVRTLDGYTYPDCVGYLNGDRPAGLFQWLSPWLEMMVVNYTLPNITWAHHVSFPTWCFSKIEAIQNHWFSVEHIQWIVSFWRPPFSEPPNPRILIVTISILYMYLLVKYPHKISTRGIPHDLSSWWIPHILCYPIHYFSEDAAPI